MTKKIIAYFILFLGLSLIATVSGCSNNHSDKSENKDPQATRSQSGTLNKSTKTLKIESEAEAVAEVIKTHPEFPGKTGIIEGKEDIGGPAGSKASVKYETTVEKSGKNTYLVILTKTWGIKIGSKTPVSTWKYEVSPTGASLISEDTSGDNLVRIIK